MAKLKINAESVELAAAAFLVLQAINPLELCTYRAGRQERVWQVGNYYDSSKTYPAPPLRAHTTEHPDFCADCADFRRWRATYETRIAAEQKTPLPQMVAPHPLFREGLTPELHPGASPEEWLNLVAVMISQASRTRLRETRSHLGG